MYEDFHLSDEQLLLGAEGELSPQDLERAGTHLSSCERCRERLRELENAMADYVRIQQREFDADITPNDDSRALLKARLGQLSESSPDPSPAWFRPAYHGAFAAVIGVLLVVLTLLFLRAGMESRKRSGTPMAVFSLPDPGLTPGAAVLIDRRTLCRQGETNNKTVPAGMQRKVFEEYRIYGADPRAYEVDYLVTPALGGADDIRNLWPHSYSATIWNASVKDALEIHLRRMVCGGNLELEEAQREIAADWIAAYKKYFHTSEPLAEHRRMGRP